LATLNHFDSLTHAAADKKTAIPGWPSYCIEPPETSGLVDGFLDCILGFAHGLLGFAFLLLHLAFHLQLGVIGRFADTLLDVADGFVSQTFCLIRCAAHGISPKNNSGFWSLRKD
jgi:hypothetical protein